MTRARRGMALAMVISLMSLIAILAVATLSLAGRLMQTSSLGLRDARLDAGAAFGLSSAVEEWRQRSLGRLAIGASRSFDAKPPGVPIAVSVSVTRVAADLFWVVAEASDGGGARRESLVLRARTADAESLSGDSTNILTLGAIAIDSIAARADLELPPGTTARPTDGVVYVRGDATLLGGMGRGILIVEGRLVIAGPVSYEGVIVARGGISVVVPGVTITGVIRSGTSPAVLGNVAYDVNGLVAQDVLRQSVMPSPAAGRRWAEMP